MPPSQSETTADFRLTLTEAQRCTKGGYRAQLWKTEMYAGFGSALRSLWALAACLGKSACASKYVFMLCGMIDRHLRPPARLTA